jgi:hypothetical protein
MLARPQDLHGERTVIHGTGSEDDRVDVVPCEKLRITARGNSEPLPNLLGTPLPDRRDRHQLGPGKPVGVLGVERAHPAKTGDAEPKRTRRP